MLILPSTRRAVIRHPIALAASQFYCYSDVAGAKATVPSIIGEIHSVPRNEALRWLCSLSKGILAEGGMKAGTQLQWAKQLLPSEWCQKLESMMRNDREDAGAVFHRRAVWLVLQLTVISCSDTIVAISNEEVAQRLGRACFMASDVLTQIEADFQNSLPDDNVTEWMIAVLVPMLDSASARVDFDLLGRARLMWEEVPRSTEFQTELTARELHGFDETFLEVYGISLSEFLRFLVALYVRFLGKQLEPNLNPLLLDLAGDEVGKVFAEEFRTKPIALIAQTPDELAVRLLRSRQLWAFDVTPIRQRPLLEVMPGKYCCPDLTMFVRAFIDRVYFLLEDAYGKQSFRTIMGKLFECYIHRLVSEFTVTTGAGRTYLASPRFLGKTDEAADGILLWTNTAAVMEYKAGLLTIRQRLAGVPDEVFQGIGSLAVKGSGKDRKGISQLAAKIARLLSEESQIVCDGTTFSLEGCRRIYPVLICFDEAMGTHAVQKWLQPQFDAELVKLGVTTDRLGPLMVLTARDVEALTTAGQSISVEQVLAEYSQHLVSQPKDFTGTFLGVLRYKFGPSVQWENSLTFRKHREALEELMPRFTSLRNEKDASDTVPGDHETL
jgi:hypothetical protein